MTSRNVYVEIGQDSLKALAGDDGLELSLERLENRRLNPVHVEKLVASLRDFLKKHGSRPAQRAFCAIGAWGVSLRRMTLPAASNEELQRILPLQIEREFPLPPDELAWGYQILGNGSGKTQELVVVAVKKELVQEYSDILSASGLSPEFTLGALVRSSLAPRPPASYAVLDLGHNHSELIFFENGAPSSIRIFPWGGTLVGTEFESLAKAVQTNGVGQKLYFSGDGARLNDIAPQLAKAIGVECERIEVPSGEGRSAAILGLKKSCEDGGSPPLLLQLKTSRAAETIVRPDHWKWAALAGVLILVSFTLRYAESFIQRPRLANKISEIKSYRDKLPQVDRELSFLQYLKTNQPPYLEPIFVMANASPGGARIESLSMNRRGDFALRASMRDSQQVGEFRSKLINSGFFSTVMVEEQTPTADKQKIVVRIVGQWKPSDDGKSPAGELARPESEKSKSPPREVKAASSVITGTPPPTAINPPTPRMEPKD